MTQEEKALVIKDLSMRLPYGVICNVTHKDGRWKTEDMKLSGVFNEDSQYFTCESGSAYSSTFKPYLRPMSSMTKEEYGQYMEFIEWSHNDYDGTVTTCINKERLHEYMNFIYSHHLDDNNLIVKGLALEAPEDMYK